jgi:hypothetical protein
MGLKPRFELDIPAPRYPKLKDLEPFNLLAARYESKLSNLTGLRDLSQEMIKAYRILRHQITDKGKVSGLQEMGIVKADFISLQLYSYQLAYRLIALVQYKLPESNQNALIYELFGNAGLAHYFMFTWNSPILLRDPITISARIRASLDIINIPAFQIAYPEIMLWIITVGGLASIGSEHQAWYIKLLAESCRAAGIARTAELALFLTEFLWSEFYLGSIFNEFWADVTNEIGKGGADELELKLVGA